jgi:hypothetical protein
MANPMKGEVTFEAEGKQYTFLYSLNSMSIVEGIAKKPFGKVVDELRDEDKISMTTVQLMFWAGLQDHHKDISMEGASNLAQSIGGIVEVMKRITDAVNLMADPTGENKGERPRKPARQQQIGPAH